MSTQTEDLIEMQRFQQELPYTALLSVYSLLALHRLLSDTEIAKDVIQDVFRVNLACNAAEVVQGLPDVAGDQITGHTVFQPLSCF